jgi:hypothetical protein
MDCALVNTELTEKIEVDLIGRLIYSINSWLSGVLACASSLAKARATLQLENIALRHPDQHSPAGTR